MRTIWTRWDLGILSVLLVFIMVNGAAAQQVTFTKDVAPVLQEKCQVCHRPGTFAPMSLLTYEEARPWAKAIREKVLAREMPPWFLERNVGIQKMKDDVSLSDEELAKKLEERGLPSWVFATDRPPLELEPNKENG